MITSLPLQVRLQHLVKVVRLQAVAAAVDARPVGPQAEPRFHNTFAVLSPSANRVAFHQFQDGISTPIPSL
ncbi:hypothetical protein ROS1_21760 [Roseibium sp. ROS1]